MGNNIKITFDRLCHTFFVGIHVHKPKARNLRTNINLEPFLHPDKKKTDALRSQNMIHSSKETFLQ
jgi:hypothetical protein